MSADPEALLKFWFDDALESAAAAERRSALWFSANADFDREITRRYRDLPERAAAGELDGWRETDVTALALVLAVDQFPRNLFRGSAKAFAFDPLACEVACAAIDTGFDRTLHPLQAVFVYLPLEHAEDIAMQERCVELVRALENRAPPDLRPRFEEFTGYAERHRDVVRRFGRFPHRNDALGRESTADETRYLTGGGDTFG